MTTMLEFRDRVIEVLKEKMPDFVTVEAIKGSLTEEGMERLSVRSPGALVALLGFRELKPLDTGIYRANMVMAIFVVTEGQDRLEQGHELLQDIGLLIAGNTWGLPGTKMPMEIKGEPIYDDRYKDREERTRHLQESGWFLQGISWTQETRVSRPATNTVRARQDDVDQDRALGRNTDSTVWPVPDKMEARDATDFAPVRDTPGQESTEEV